VIAVTELQTRRFRDYSVWSDDQALRDLMRWRLLGARRPVAASVVDRVMEQVTAKQMED